MTETKQTASGVEMPFPAGSFDLADLEKAGDKVVKAKEKDRQRVADDELGKINQRVDAVDIPGRLPGHRVETVERVLEEGVEEPVEGGKKGETQMVGEVRVTENIQVFDRKLADEEREAAGQPALTGGGGDSGAAAATAATAAAASAGAGA